MEILHTNKNCKNTAKCSTIPGCSWMAKDLMKLERAPHECSSDDREGEISQHYYPTTLLVEEVVAFTLIMDAVLTAGSKQAMTASHLYE